MTDRVERFGEVKEDKQGDHSLINGQPDIVNHLNQRSLCTIASTEARLEEIHKLGAIQVGGELVMDYALKDF